VASEHVFGVARSILGRPWRWRGGPPGDLADAARLGIDDVTARLFTARGVRLEDVAQLRQPTIRELLPDPSIFRDMDAAAKRIADAVIAGEAIVIFGDYDVDGATSAALLIRSLRGCGANVSHYIPDRLLEGYGPSAGALVALKAAGADLVVCVDCGTQAFAALDAARASGLDVVVVDHHKASTALPPAVAIVNPNRLDEGEGAAFGNLAAVGVSFLVAVAVNRELRARGWFDRRPEPRLTDLLDIVALGTVADVVPLTGLNRAFVAQGLKVLAARRNPGLAALAAVARIERAPRAADLGFAFGPRINAGGRVGQADLGVRLLCGEDPDELAAIAAELGRLNDERRAIEAAVTDAAIAMAERAAHAPIAVVAGDGWHPGVIGIAAGRLKDRLGVPAIVIGFDGDGAGKGSGRSIAGVDLGAAVLAARDAGLICAGGGHAMAAGLTVSRDRVDELARFLCARLDGEVARARAADVLNLDLALAPGGITVALADALESAGPYGAAWPQPRVAAGPFAIIKSDIVGGDHVRIIASGGDGARLKAVAFRSAATPLGAALLAAAGRRLWLAGRVARDDWGPTPRAELHIDDAAWV
jgi:single-stranded-DNA-specific exonuclease